jgi:magnesium chelatase family protein
MGVSKVFSAALQGLNVQLIEIEAMASRGLRSFNIVGLGDKSIAESKERVSSAIKSAKLSPPHHQTKRVVINLAPADLKKEGSLYDLPIALSYLLSSNQTEFDPQSKLILGELALDGALKPIKGALSFSLFCKKKGMREIILPQQNAKEAALVTLLGQKKVKVIGVSSLQEALAYLEGRKLVQETEISPLELNRAEEYEIEFGWIKGQNFVKRGLEIAAAGGHNIFLEGPPGTGKTLLAKSVPSILPPLSFEELLEVTQVYSGLGILGEKFLLNKRPFRAPHHTSSEVSLIGGGNPPRAGEITLAHRGVLFLDEFPEFHRNVLESLRVPLEEGKITLQRAKYNLSFPASFMLIASANPCPCGYYNDPEKECSCYPSQIASYRRKLTGPLMDRFDIFCWVPSLKYQELISEEKIGESAKVRERVERARAIQALRFKTEKIHTNAEMKLPQIKKYCQIDSASKNFLKGFINSRKISVRGYHRVLKTARTIADLEGREQIALADISEAITYRLREEKD